MRNRLTGILFFLIGSVFWYLSQGYEFGSAQDIGPGFFPSLVSMGLIISALVVFFTRDK